MRTLILTFDGVALAFVMAAVATLALGNLPAVAQDPAGGSATFVDAEVVIGTESIGDDLKNTCAQVDDDGLNSPIVDLGSKDRCFALSVGDGYAGDCVGVIDTVPGGTVTCSVTLYGNLSGHCDAAMGSDGWGAVSFSSGHSLQVKELRAHYTGIAIELQGKVGKTNSTAMADDAGRFEASLRVKGTTDDGQDIVEACLEDNGLDSFQADGTLQFQGAR